MKCGFLLMGFNNLINLVDEKVAIGVGIFAGFDIEHKGSLPSVFANQRTGKERIFKDAVSCLLHRLRFLENLLGFQFRFILGMWEILGK